MTYVFVFIAECGTMFTRHRDSEADFIDFMEWHHEMTGRTSKGDPKFNGVYGPMYDGGTIRYECPKTYDRLSV